MEIDSPKEILDKLRSKLYDTDSMDDMDTLDQIINKVTSNIINKDTRNYADMVKSQLGDRIASLYNDEPNNNSIGSDVDTVTRFLRYLNADDLVDHITYCATALRVLTDSIVSPDDVTKQSIQVLHDTIADGEDEIADSVKNIIKGLKLQNFLRDVVEGTLQYGDQFVEICDYTADDVPVTQSMLNEDKDNNGNISDELLTENLGLDIEYKINVLNEIGSEYHEEDRKVNITINLLETEADQINLEKPIRDVPIEHVRTIHHNPNSVVKLQSKRFRMCLGYLVLPIQNGNSGSAIGNNGSNAGSGQSLANPSSNGTYSTGTSTGGFGNLLPSASMQSGVDQLYVSLLHKVKRMIGNKNADPELNKDELSQLLKRVLAELDPNSKENKINLQIRYVPDHRMQHFYTSVRKFYPYGEGMFHRIMFPAKLLIALETCLTIKRISDSVDTRIITVEANMARDSRNEIETMKNAFKKARFSVDKMGTISSIPSSIVNYENIYLTQSKGKKYVEFDTLPPSSSISQFTDDLKYFRDQIISGTSVPPAFLGEENAINSKNTLAFESINFAQTIVGLQTIFSYHLKEFLAKIYKLIYNKKLPDGLTVTFPPPRMLQLQKDSEKASMDAQLVQNYVEMGVPKEWAVRKFVDLPWNEIDDFKRENKLDQQIAPQDPNNMDMMGGMGGMGGGMGMSPDMGMGGLPSAMPNTNMNATLPADTGIQ